MKLNSKLIAIKALLAVVAVALFSFTVTKGGDSFEIWLNGKKVIQQFVPVSKAIQTLHLTQTSKNDRLDIYYSHCGQTGNNRYITIKDDKDIALKVWKFTDATGSNASMSFKLKDILSLKKSKTDKLGLFYSSRELPDGRLLAIIDSDNESGIARK